MSRYSSDSGGWFKWIVGTIIACLAAGSGIVALLNYFSPKPLPPPTRVPPTSAPPTTVQLQVWINEYEDGVEFVREESDGTQIYNWSLTVKITASTSALARFEIWAFGVDANGNQIQYQVSSSVYETNTDQITLPDFWVLTSPQARGWRIAEIVFVERLAVRVVSIDDGSILVERDVMRDSQ